MTHESGIVIEKKPPEGGEEVNDIPDEDEEEVLPPKPRWNRQRLFRLFRVLGIALLCCIAIALWAPKPGGNANATFSKIGAAVGQPDARTNK
jgi:hypothetical protein